MTCLIGDLKLSNLGVGSVIEIGLILLHPNIESGDIELDIKELIILVGVLILKMTLLHSSSCKLGYWG